METNEILKIVPVGTETDEQIIVMGKYKVVDRVFEKRDEAETYIESKPYELIMGMVAVMIEINKNNENEKNK